MEGLTDDLQQQTLLWIHHFWFCWARSEEGRIEAVGVLHETTVAHRHHTRHLGMWPKELEVGPNKGVERKKNRGKTIENKRQFGTWQHEMLGSANMKFTKLQEWKCCLDHPEMASRHHLAGMQMAVSFLDPVETPPHLHQSRHPHGTMESQQCRPCQWTIRAPTQPASRSLPGCLAVFCCCSGLSRKFNGSKLEWIWCRHNTLW